MSSEYRNYLLAKNKANEKNLSSYKTRYETAIGKMTPEEAQVQLELNDNQIDEMQINEELRDLLRKYIPNTYYLDSVLNSKKLTDDMKYNLYLNFATYVEPKVNAIRNRKISVEKFTAFLVQLANDLAQSGLTASMNTSLQQLTGAFRSQINQYQGNLAGMSHDDLAETLVKANIDELDDNKITKASIGGKNARDIKLLIIKLLEIDRIMLNYEKSVGIKRPFGVNVIDSNTISSVTVPQSNNKTQLQIIYQNYFENITNESAYKTIPFSILQEAYQARQGLVSQPQSTATASASTPVPAPTPTPAPVNPAPFVPSSSTFTPVIIPSSTKTPTPPPPAPVNKTRTPTPATPAPAKTRTPTPVSTTLIDLNQLLRDNSIPITYDDIPLYDPKYHPDLNKWLDFLVDYFQKTSPTTIDQKQALSYVDYVVDMFRDPNTRLGMTGKATPPPLVPPTAPAPTAPSSASKNKSENNKKKKNKNNC